MRLHARFRISSGILYRGRIEEMSLNCAESDVSGMPSSGRKFRMRLWLTSSVSIFIPASGASDSIPQPRRVRCFNFSFRRNSMFAAGVRSRTSVSSGKEASGEGDGMRQLRKMSTRRRPLRSGSKLCGCASSRVSPLTGMSFSAERSRTEPPEAKR